MKKKDKKKYKKRFYYKVIHQKNKPNKFTYFWELVFSFSIEIIRRAFVYLFRFGLGCILLFILGTAIFIPISDKVVPTVRVSEKSDFKQLHSTVIYAENGEKIACLNGSNEITYAEYEDIPQNVVNAFVAIEDRTFWNNLGIDTKGITRVTLNYIASKGKEVHGASTITQQLARNIYLSHEVSMERKIKEILISLGLTEKYSKEEIMEFYCNNICFANGIYGVENASKAYFNKSLKELTLSETAYICAIPNSPEYYNPYIHPERALQRRDKILKDMYTCHYISKTELDEALIQNIEITKPEKIFHNYETTYAIFCASEYLMKEDGFAFRYKFKDMDDYKKYQESYKQAYSVAKEKLYTGGYEIHTSLNLDLCEEFQENVDEILSFNNEKDENGTYKLQGAVTCIDNETGKVTAIVGGRTSNSEENVYTLNRAFQSFRQPGSSLKPLIVYTPALENGYSPESVIPNISVSKAKEKGVNARELSGNKISIQKAVWKSENGVAWRLLDEITPECGLSYLQNMNFSKICPEDYNDASALGGLTYGTTTVEMAGGYRTLVNDGKYRKPTCITSIINNEKEEIYKEDREERVYQSKSAESMVNILKGVLISGTAKDLKWADNSETEAMCKTGTTNDSKDGWLCGSTPYYSIAAWVGFDTPKELNGLYGASYPGEIWKECMLDAIVEKPSIDFSSFQQQKKISYNAFDNQNSSYEKDRELGEQIQVISEQIKNKKGNPKELYQKGVSLAEQISDTVYANEVMNRLNEAYLSL